MGATAISRNLRVWLPDLPQARCAKKEYDPDLWHHDAKRSQETRRAMSICHTCPVMQECLSWAVLHRPLVMGVWGGLWFRNYSKVRKKS